VNLSNELLYRTGIKLMNKGRWQEAADSFTAALANDARNGRYLISRAECLIALNDYQTAIRDYESAAKVKDFVFQAHMGIARCKEATDDLKGALASYSEVALLNPKFPEVYLSRGKVFHRLGDKKEALEDFKKGISLACIDPLEFFQQQELTEYIELFGRKTPKGSRSIDEIIDILCEPENRPFSENRANLYELGFGESGAYEEDIGELQAFLQIRFPQSYSDFLTVFDGGDFRHLRIFSATKGKQFSIYDELDHLQKDFAKFPKQLIPIASDYDGDNLFCFNLNREHNGEYEIVKWETAYAHNELVHVADKFTEFVEQELLMTNCGDGRNEDDSEDERSEGDHDDEYF
jgi:tetratricopeptide (TPR) repeat protein